MYMSVAVLFLSFFSCSKISSNGVCYQSSCEVTKHKSTETSIEIKHVKISNFLHSHIQPLSDPLVFCLIHVKPAVMKACTTSLLLLQSMYNSSHFWAEMEKPQAKGFTYFTPVKISSSRKVNNVFWCFALAEFITFTIGMICLILLMGTKTWKKIIWTLL